MNDRRDGDAADEHDALGGSDGTHGDGVQGDGHVDVAALVLGHVDAQRRAGIATHLLACGLCRREFDEMSATVRELLPAVPEVQPPLGFDQQVLARFGIAAAPRRRSVATRRALTGVAAALLVAVAIVGWRVTNSDEPSSAGDVRSLQRVSGGSGVGTVSIGDVDGEAVMVVAVVDAPPGVSYRCRTTFADGTTTESPAWPAGSGAWIVPIPEASVTPVDTVDLVIDGTDIVWSTASFRSGS